MDSKRQINNNFRFQFKANLFAHIKRFSSIYCQAISKSVTYNPIISQHLHFDFLVIFLHYLLPPFLSRASSDDRGRLIFKLNALHRRSLEGIGLNGLFIKWLQGRLEQVVGICRSDFKLLSHIRSRCPTRFESRGEDLTLVALEVVIFVLSLLNSGVERGCLASEALLARFSFEFRSGMREKVGSFAGSFESLCMQICVDCLVVTARQEMHPVDLSICQLVSGQSLDVTLQVVVMVRAVAPGLLGRSRLLRQELLLALHRILLVLRGFRTTILFNKEVSNWKWHWHPPC